MKTETLTAEIVSICFASTLSWRRSDSVVGAVAILLQNQISMEVNLS